HDDCGGDAAEAIEARGNREAEASRVVGGDAEDPLVRAVHAVDDLRRPVAARVVDDEQLVVDRGGLERGREAAESCLDRSRLVVRRTDDRKHQVATPQVSTLWSNIFCRTPSIPSWT